MDYKTKIHIIAHCIGGLAMHISLLGGHISASHIASISCVNSSMFFKLTTSALVKMWLPLVPVNNYILLFNYLFFSQVTTKRKTNTNTDVNIAVSLHNAGYNGNSRKESYLRVVFCK